MPVRAETLPLMSEGHNRRRRTARTAIMLSEDAAFVASFKDALEAGGLGVVVGADPAWALGEIARSAYAAVVVDTDGLSGMGATIVAKLRKHHPHRVVLLTATDASAALLSQVSESATHRFVAKPVDAAREARWLTEACGRGKASGRRGSTGGQPIDHGLGGAGKHRLSREALLANQQLQNANEMLRKQVSQLTILYQMGRDISENENWSDALDRFLMALVSYSKADGAALLLFSRNAQRLSPRSNFQVDEPALNLACEVLGNRWRENPRGFEMHSVECYGDRLFHTCLERLEPWRMTVVPLRYRSFVWGFLLLDKRYASNVNFRPDYAFLSTIQTILAEEVANASYISDLRQLSRLNQKVLENIQSGVVTTDLEGHVVFWNRLAVTMCPRLVGGARVHFDELCRVPGRSGSLFAEITGSAEDTHVLDVSYHGVHGRDLPGRLRITKMHDDNLNGTVLVGILEDLTEEKKMEAEIRRTDRLRVLGQVSAGMAHEIGNPLTGIMSTAELLARHSVHDEKKLGWVRMILEETCRLRDILYNLQSFARPAKPEIRRCALAEVSARVVGLLSDQAQKKGVELRISGAATDAACLGDPNQLVQVLLNLVLNAIDACGRGNAVEIAIAEETHPERRDERVARIDVIDDGPGIPAEIRESLFEPFVTTKTHGTGLGLAISRQIVEEHHGDIRCDCPGKGTRFTIRLPLGTDEPAAAARRR